MKTRKKNLASQANLDNISYQPGNIVLAHNVPSSTLRQGSQELKSTVENIYYIKTVNPSHLRLIQLFTGIEGSLPVEHMTKLHLTDLAKIQFALESHHMAPINSRLQK